jgi:zinc D-Ala-D-Ala carboxypeptidase
MKYKYRLRSKKPLFILMLIVVLLTVIISYGCNHTRLNDFFSGNKGTSGLPQKPTAELIRKQTLESAVNQGLLVLVNKQHPLAENYIPNDLTPMKYYASDRDASGRYMREPAAVAFSQLVENAALEGYELKMTTAYRSFHFQNLLYNNYVSQYGEQAANRFSAKPGQSEHQTGLAVDVSSPSVEFELTVAFGDTAEGRWLAVHAHEYGFILRYPEGKEDITGYLYEPWHLRYVGLFAAKEIFQQGISLEEYLESNDLMEEIK